MLLLDNNLAFIRSKILQAGNALIHFCDNTDIPDRTCIVNTIDVDEDGCIWITLPFPWDQQHVPDNFFAADMSYYRKGKNFYLDIKGVVQAVKAEEIIHAKLTRNNYHPFSDSNKLLLMRFKIISANYTETSSAPEYFFQKYIHNIRKWWITRHAAKQHEALA
jgi:hypothetical protein